MNSNTDDRARGLSILDGSDIHLLFRGKAAGCYPEHVMRSWDLEIFVNV